MQVFQIQLPLVANNGTSNLDAINSILSTISDIAGGLTAHNAQGIWKDAQGRLIRDEVLNVQTYTDNAQALIALVNDWRIALDQDALVWATWQAQIEFVSGE